MSGSGSSSAGVLDRARQALSSPSSGYGATGNGKPAPPPPANKPVEPKVYLAVERTFLSWCRISVLLGTLAIGLYNIAGHGENPTFAKVLGAIYTLIAIAVIAYAFAMQRTRLRWIDIRYAGHHDELRGPLALSAVLFAAVLLNFILRVVNRSEALPAPKQPWTALLLAPFVRIEGSV